MKSLRKYIPLLLVICLATACDKYVNVANPDTLTDPGFWKNENNVRAYCWEFYDMFTGYGNNGSTSGDFYFSTFTDDQDPSNFTQFPLTTSASNGSWAFGYIRKANILLERINLTDMDDASKNHWRGVARFFRAMQYFELVQTFGGVPWISHSLDISDSSVIYKPRDTHEAVMDSVLQDIDFAVDNLRETDEPNTVTKNVALALKARICLFEGTYRKYHTELHMPDADKFLAEAKDAAETLMTSGGYTLDKDYQTVYNSEDLSGDKEVILFKRYEQGYLAHSVIAYLTHSTAISGLTKNAVESYLCTDGKPIGSSGDYKGDATLADVMANRDERLKITLDSTQLYYIGHVINSLTSTTGYRVTKFLPDSNILKTIPTDIAQNYTDAPLFWLPEVLLDYAEASAELDDLGKYTITQTDLDNTVNKLRARGGVAPLELTGHQQVAVTDPIRDPDVTPLIWEIRRERRVELMMDGFRFQDLMRWKKGDYMDSQKNPDSFLGAKVPANGEVRTNSAGYIMPYEATRQRTFTDPKNYLSAIPTSQILLYPPDIQKDMQNPGW